MAARPSLCSGHVLLSPSMAGAPVLDAQPRPLLCALLRPWISLRAHIPWPALGPQVAAPWTPWPSCLLPLSLNSAHFPDARAQQSLTPP
ncbi:hypothetical protein Zm00014a_035642 [Zea mays]|uniref:Uncharacterized protein n=1 Tax=Zea mays TaxID=4577 RepID=A0A3L6EWH2_MAIZE|nr:hypothetical protein Zm00014a_035642 [Zea mays]